VSPLPYEVFGLSSAMIDPIEDEGELDKSTCYNDEENSEE
jgi:hypothetical protein